MDNLSILIQSLPPHHDEASWLRSSHGYVDNIVQYSVAVRDRPTGEVEDQNRLCSQSDQARCSHNGLFGGCRLAAVWLNNTALGTTSS